MANSLTSELEELTSHVGLKLIVLPLNEQGEQRYQLANEQWEVLYPPDPLTADQVISECAVLLRLKALDDDDPASLAFKNPH